MFQGLIVLPKYFHIGTKSNERETKNNNIGNNAINHDNQDAPPLHKMFNNHVQNAMYITLNTNNVNVSGTMQL